MKITSSTTTVSVPVYHIELSQREAELLVILIGNLPYPKACQILNSELRIEWNGWKYCCEPTNLTEYSNFSMALYNNLRQGIVDKS